MVVQQTLAVKLAPTPEQHVALVATLERFNAAPPSPLEKREQLEQLRALEDGMRIDVTLVDSVPVEVNTPDDLERARRIISGKGRP